MDHEVEATPMERRLRKRLSETSASHGDRTCITVFFVASVFLMTFSIFLLLLLRLASASLPQPPPDSGFSEGPMIQMKSNTLNLAIFADLHYGEDEAGGGIDQDLNSTRVMRDVLDYEDALDLVVLDGDLITGEDTLQENSSAYVNQIVAPMVDKQIPWASTYGNHDSKFNLSRQSIFEVEKTYPLSLTQQMDPSLPGVTNYYLIVLAQDGTPAAVLWFFDSRGGASYHKDPANEDDIPNWVASETAEWFVRTSGRLRARYGQLPSLAFVHIPPHPFLTLQRAGLDPTHFPGVNDDVPVAIQGSGDDDDAFVNALLEEELLHSVYVGHDHGNSWCATWPEQHGAGIGTRGKRHGDDHRGAFLCFSKHTGYGGYGEWNRGARIVQVKLEDLDGDGHFDGEDEIQVQTWVRMEAGGVVTSVSLNKTYGIDNYSTDTGEKQ